MKQLYLSWKNKPVTAHSYSSGGTFHFCRFKYKLEKLLGWREKEKKASLHFGKCIESAMKFHVDNKEAGGPEDFVQRWDKVKDIPDLSYTDQEKNWDELKVMGISMMNLFGLWWPTTGFEDPKWQLEYKKEVFPNTEYAGLEFTSYIDLRVKKDGVPRFIDIKTAKAAYTEEPDMLRLDPQLADYSWATGIPNAGFLVLVKGGRSFSKGDRVTVLDTGVPRRVLFADSNAGTVSIGFEEDYEKYDAEQKNVKGKALDAIKAKYAAAVATVPAEALTKCKLQYLTSTIPPDRIQEAGEMEGQTMVDIISCSERDSWPKTGAGIRFPNMNCTFCSHRGICTGNDKLRDELLIKLGAEAPEEKDWMDDIVD
jgi:hypothetical protein